MKRYKCHKVVEAAKIAGISRWEGGGRIDFEGQSVTVDAAFMARVPRHKPVDGETYDAGYLVRYADGYESWSPTKAFEEGYMEVQPEPSPADVRDEALRQHGRSMAYSNRLNVGEITPDMVTPDRSDLAERVEKIDKRLDTVERSLATVMNTVANKVR